MQFKQKLAYMALGGLLVFMGMLLPALMNRSAVAQNNKRVASFDEITCKRLNIVDDYGRTYAVLEKNGYDAIRILNSSGTPVCSLGGDGNGGYLNIDHHTGRNAVTIAIDNSDKEGLVKVRGKDGKSFSQLSIGKYGGVVSAYGKDGKSGSQLGIDEYGGILSIFNKGEQNCFEAGITDRGNGMVITTDKNGYRTGRLP